MTGFATLVLQGMVTDYSRLPPDAVFTRILGMSQPSTVKKVRTSGYGIGGGQPVCIKLELDTTNLEWMHSHFTPVNAQEFRQQLDSLPDGRLGDWNRQGRQELGCDCRGDEKELEFFRVEYVDPPAVWLGVAALNRSRGWMCLFLNG